MIHVANGYSVTVLIPTWRRPAYLARALRAVVGQRPRPMEVVVVGRDEDAEGRSVVDSLAPDELTVRWVGGAEPGHVKPVVLGLANARGDIMAVIDDDAEPDEGWLEALLLPFANPRVACVGGRVITPGWSGVIHPDAGQIRWYGKHVGNLAALAAPHPFEVAAVMEGNWAWRTERLRSLRFEPDLDVDEAFMYGLDLCLQARDRGWTVIYESRARVVHHVAPRDPALDRRDRVGRARARARNYTIIGLRRFRGVRRVAFLVWWMLIGENANYGPLGALGALMRGHSQVGALTKAALLGRWDGVRGFLERGAR